MVRDSFSAANKIKEIPKELFDEGYRFVSFDVESLFTSVPLNKTINIILDRIYNKKLLNTNIKKRTMKKLLKDCCTKNALTFDNVIYEQIDGVSMGSCLGLVLGNIIIIVDKLFKENVLKFYLRYMLILWLNSFHPNLKFTVDKIYDGMKHYLDIKIIDNENRHLL